MPPIRTRSPARVAAQGVARAHALSAAAAALSLADLDDFTGDGAEGLDGLPVVMRDAAQYPDLDFTPPQGVRDAFARGVELFEAGHGGDGLRPATIAWARRLAAGEDASPAKLVKMRAWHARHAVDRRPGWANPPTPGYVAYMLWGGEPGRVWAETMVDRMERADAAREARALSGEMAGAGDALLAPIPPADDTQALDPVSPEVDDSLRPRLIPRPMTPDATTYRSTTPRAAQGTAPAPAPVQAIALPPGTTGVPEDQWRGGNVLGPPVKVPYGDDAEADMQAAADAASTPGETTGGDVAREESAAERRAFPGAAPTPAPSPAPPPAPPQGGTRERGRRGPVQPRTSPAAGAPGTPGGAGEAPHDDGLASRILVETPATDAAQLVTDALPEGAEDTMQDRIRAEAADALGVDAEGPDGGIATPKPAGRSTVAPDAQGTGSADPASVESVAARLNRPASHNGVALVLTIPWASARLFAVRDGLPPEELHITLLYLGQRAAQPDGRGPALQSLVRRIASSAPAPALRISGVGRFMGADTDPLDGTAVDAIYLAVDSRDTLALRARVVAEAAELGATSASEHGFTPHITVVYVPQGTERTDIRPDLIGKRVPGSLDFDAASLALWWGDDRYAVPFRRADTDASTSTDAAPSLNAVAPGDITAKGPPTVDGVTADVPTFPALGQGGPDNGVSGGSQGIGPGPAPEAPARPSLTPGAVSFDVAGDAMAATLSAAWNREHALGRLRAWASSDGTGEWSRVDVRRYSRAFAFVGAPTVPAGNGERGYAASAFLFPHHDVVAGGLALSRAGLARACLAFSRMLSAGAQGDGAGASEPTPMTAIASHGAGSPDVPAGTGAATRAALSGDNAQTPSPVPPGGIPMDQIDSVRDHLSRHCEQLGVTPPWQATRPTQTTEMRPQFVSVRTLDARPPSQGAQPAGANAAMDGAVTSAEGDAAPPTMVEGATLGPQVLAVSWIQVAKVGEFRGHTMGPFRFTTPIFEEIIRNFRGTRNGAVPLDYEHATERMDGSIPMLGAPAVGYFTDLALRGGGKELWGKVEWVDQTAVDHVRAGRYRYFSPAVVFDYTHPESGHCIGAALVSGGLTNRPFLDGMAPVTARAVAVHQPPLQPVDREAVDGDGAPAPWDGDEAEAALRRWASAGGTGAKVDMDWPRYREGFAWYDSDAEDGFGAYKLPHHVVVDGELRTSRRGVEAAIAALNGARGGVTIPAEEREAVYRHLANHYALWGGEAPALLAVHADAVTARVTPAAIDRWGVPCLVASARAYLGPADASERVAAIVTLAAERVAHAQGTHAAPGTAPTTAHTTAPVTASSTGTPTTAPAKGTKAPAASTENARGVTASGANGTRSGTTMRDTTSTPAATTTAAPRSDKSVRLRAAITAFRAGDRAALMRWYEDIDDREDLMEALRAMLGLPKLGGDDEVRAGIDRLMGYVEGDMGAADGVEDAVRDLVGCLRRCLNLPALARPAEVVGFVKRVLDTPEGEALPTFTLAVVPVAPVKTMDAIGPAQVHVPGGTDAAADQGEDEERDGGSLADGVRADDGEDDDEERDMDGGDGEGGDNASAPGMKPHASASPKTPKTMRAPTRAGAKTMMNDQEKAAFAALEAEVQAYRQRDAAADVDAAIRAGFIPEAGRAGALTLRGTNPRAFAATYPAEAVQGRLAELAARPAVTTMSASAPLVASQTAEALTAPASGAPVPMREAPAAGSVAASAKVAPTREAIAAEATRRAAAKIPRTMKADATTFRAAINEATAEVCAELGVDFNALPRDAAPAA